MIAELRTSRTLILPVIFIGRAQTPHPEAAEKIAQSLKEEGFSNLRASDLAIELPFTPQSNEAAIFWERAKAFSSYIKEHPQPDADYIILLDVFGSPEKNLIGAVHATGTDAQGRIAYIGFWNSHWELFKEIQPKSLDDACRMLVTDLVRQTRAGESTEKNDNE